MRFRKSIQIVKGVRVNFSKSGISTTIGGRGASVNIGKRGTYLNTGIPGTGLYDRTKISGSSGSSSRTRNTMPLPIGKIKVIVDDGGNVEIRGANDIPITDESMLRRIKRTDDFKALKTQLMGQLKEGIEKENSNFIDIFKLSTNIATLADFKSTQANLKPNRYAQVPFNELAPKEDDVKAQLQIEAKQNVKTMAFWKLRRLREDYVNNELPTRYSDLSRNWESRKAEHEQLQATIAEETNASYRKEYELAAKALEDAITGKSEYIEYEIDKWISSVVLPVDFSIQFEYIKDEFCIMLDLDLPEIESIPAEKAVELASGQVKRKPKTQKEVKYDYMRCVYGLAVFFASYIFNISPVINKIVVSGYTQRRNKKTGDIQDDYIYSTKFLRSHFEYVDFENIDIMSFWGKFESRCLPTQTYELKTIVPF